MDTDSSRIVLGPQLPSRIFEIADQLLLFRIHRNDRLVTGLKWLDLLVNMLNLGIAVQMRAALERLAVGLQAITHLLEQGGNQAMARLMSQPCQVVRQLAHAFGGPARGRLRIASGHRV